MQTIILGVPPQKKVRKQWPMCSSLSYITTLSFLLLSFWLRGYIITQKPLNKISSKHMKKTLYKQPVPQRGLSLLTNIFTDHCRRQYAVLRLTEWGHLSPTKTGQNMNTEGPFRMSACTNHASP
jgi:hypothetical protein